MVAKKKNKPVQTIRYEPEVLEKAKAMYMEAAPLSKIIEATGMTRSALLYHVPDWRAVRDAEKYEIIEALTESKKALLFSIAKHGLEVLAKSMEKLNKSNTPLSPKEMMGVANIVDSLDKIAKLDDGNPTEIMAEIRPATTIEIKKMLQKDPFFQMEEEEAILLEPKKDDHAEITN